MKFILAPLTYPFENLYIVLSRDTENELRQQSFLSIWILILGSIVTCGITLMVFILMRNLIDQAYLYLSATALGCLCWMISIWQYKINWDSRNLSLWVRSEYILPISCAVIWGLIASTTVYYWLHSVHRIA
jgi:hypothetical protein